MRISKLSTSVALLSVLAGSVSGASIFSKRGDPKPKDCSALKGQERIDCLNYNYDNGFYNGPGYENCEHGQIACKGGEFHICDNGEWSNLGCAESTSCSAHFDENGEVLDAHCDHVSVSNSLSTITTTSAVVTPTASQDGSGIFNSIASITPMEKGKEGPFEYYWANVTWEVNQDIHKVKENDEFFLDMPGVFQLSWTYGSIYLYSVQNSVIGQCNYANLQQGGARNPSTRFSCYFRKPITKYRYASGYVVLPIVFDAGVRDESSALISTWNAGDNEVVFNGNLKTTVNFPSVADVKTKTVQSFNANGEIFFYFMSDDPCPNQGLGSINGGNLTVLGTAAKIGDHSAEISFAKNVNAFGFTTELSHIPKRTISRGDAIQMFFDGDYPTKENRVSYSLFLDHPGKGGAVSEVTTIFHLKCVDGTTKEYTGTNTITYNNTIHVISGKIYSELYPAKTTSTKKTTTRSNHPLVTLDFDHLVAPEL